MTAAKGTRLFAEGIPEPLMKRFRKRLIDDGLTFRQWLINAITEYLRRAR